MVTEGSESKAGVCCPLVAGFNHVTTQQMRFILIYILIEMKISYLSKLLNTFKNYNNKVYYYLFLQFI